MGHAFHDIAFTPAARALQEAHGSRDSYARLEGAATRNSELGPDEAAFIESRDSVYLATVTPDGWPYIQHRGGPAGFLRVIDPRTIEFDDYAGNRQYVSTGNLATNDRISMFLMDYARQGRLKLFGRATILDSDPQAQSALRAQGYKARVERRIRIAVAGFDWNCSQHITPRFTAAELAPVLAEIEARAKAASPGVENPVSAS